MKVAKIQLSDGRIAKFEVPDNYTQEQAQQEIEAHMFEQQKAPAQKYKPRNFAEDMSAGDQLLSGIGEGYMNTYRGAKQLFNIGDQGALKQEIADSRQLDKPLNDTAAGATGNIVGGIASTAPAMMIPGANTLLGAGLIGAGTGALMPSLDSSEAATNMLYGGAGGSAGVLAGRALPSVYSAFVSPFMEKGRQKIAGNVLREFAGGDEAAALAKLQNPEVFVPGSVPSVAEVLMTPKMSTLQKSVRNLPEGKDAIVNSEINNNGARLAALRGIAQDDAAIEAAKLARNDASKPLYDTAFGQNVEGDPALKGLLDRPSMKEAAGRSAKLAKEKGEAFKLGNDAPEQQVLSGLVDAKGSPIASVIPEQNASYTGKSLHYLKMGLDDLLDRPLEAGIGNHEKAAITGTKSDLLSWLDSKIPEYQQARQLYSELSKPISQMEVGQALKDKLAPALTENGIPTRERAAMFSDAVRNQDALIKRTTGQRNKSLADVMTPEQMAIIDGIGKDLTRKGNALDLASTRGSDTASNLIADNMLKSLIGPIGMPNSWLSKAASNTIMSALPRRAVELAVPGVEQKLQGLLAQALTDPKFAAELMKKAAPKSKLGGKMSLQEWLYPALGSAGTYGALSSN